MTVNSSKQSEKSSIAQTVRVPQELDKPLKHMLVDTGESFQAFVVRLIRRELAAPVLGTNPPLDEPLPDVQSRTSTSRNAPKEREASGDITPQERKWVTRFLNILRSGTVAARAIKWNVLTFETVLGGSGDPKSTPVPYQSTPQTDPKRVDQHIQEVEQALAAEEKYRRTYRDAAKGHREP